MTKEKIVQAPSREPLYRKTGQTSSSQSYKIVLMRMVRYL